MEKRLFVNIALLKLQILQFLHRQVNVLMKQQKPILFFNQVPFGRNDASIGFRKKLVKIKKQKFVPRTNL